MSARAVGWGCLGDLHDHTPLSAPVLANSFFVAPIPVLILDFVPNPNPHSIHYAQSHFDEESGDIAALALLPSLGQGFSMMAECEPCWMSS